MTAALRREHFSVSRAAEYFRASELQAQTGRPRYDFGHVVLKELVDNALDAAEEAGVAPAIDIIVNERGISVSDNGPVRPAPMET